MERANILIVEDEFMISEDIAMRLGDYGYRVAGIAPSAQAAIEILDKGDVDLVLVDINIDGDTDGIELAKIILDKYKIPFIYLTSLANKAVVERAKETCPSAYLLKPFNDRQVQIAIELALINYSSNTRAIPNQEHELSRSEKISMLTLNDSLFLKKDTHYDRVRFSNILYLSSQSNYTVVHTTTGYYMYACLLKTFEELLPVNVFVRVHRSFIVNLQAVTGLEGGMVFINETEIPVSKSRRDELYKNLKIL
jgi:DNA-binding LytR/AlgR family response regulator